MVQTFKCTNAKWDCTKVVMSDKNLKERTVFMKEFPNTTLHIILLVSCPEKLQKKSNNRQTEYSSR